MMMEEIEKKKDKIRKLLALSMSDNENEAAISLRLAIKLMNENNLTVEQLEGQAFIDKVIESSYLRLPIWYQDLHQKMAEVSGCYCVYSHGRKSSRHKVYGRVRIIGRERDVENSIYLITYLERALKSKVINFKKSYKFEYKSCPRRFVISYEAGFISKIYHRIKENKQKFFSETNSKALVCIDDEERYEAAKEFFKKSHGKVTIVSRNSSHIGSAYDAGVNDAANLPLNSAMNAQESIRAINYAS